MKKYFLIMICFWLIGVDIYKVNASGNIVISKNNIVLKQGDNTSFTINATNSAGLVEIKSSDKNIVSVDHDSYFFDTSLNNNNVTIGVNAINSGKATITVVLKDVATFDDEEIVGTSIINVTVNEKNSDVKSDENIKTVEFNENTQANNQNETVTLEDVPKTDFSIGTGVFSFTIMLCLFGIGLLVYFNRKKRMN